MLDDVNSIRKEIITIYNEYKNNEISISEFNRLSTVLIRLSKMYTISPKQNTDIEKEDKLLLWIKRNGFNIDGDIYIYAKPIQSKGPSYVRKKQSLMVYMSELIENGIIEEVSDIVIDGASRRTAWRIIN